MGQHVDREPGGAALGDRLDQRRAVVADRRTHRDVLVGDPRGFGVGHFEALRVREREQLRLHALQRPT